jgi:chromosome segregation ATPase
MESGTGVGESVGMEIEEASQEQTEDALSERDRRLSGLEEALGQRDARIAHLEAALGEAEDAAKRRDEEMEGVNARLAQAVELYRVSLLASEPDVPEDMVQGSTVEVVQESLARVRQMVEQVRGRMEARASLERTPLGVPARSAPDLSALSPQEKILVGLSGR